MNVIIKIPSWMVWVVGILWFGVGFFVGCTVKHDRILKECVESYAGCEVYCGENGGINRGMYGIGE